MSSNADSDFNTAVGYGALRNNTTGIENCSFGHNSSFANNSGRNNTVYGHYSSRFNTSGNYNIYLGSTSGSSQTNSRKIIIGSGNEIGLYNYTYFDSPNPNKDVQLAIGHNVTGISSYWIVGDENYNVGIGTTIPTEKLHVGGNLKISGLTSTKDLFVSGISTIGNVQISTGIITAVPGTQQIVYYGDGSKLQGVTGVKVELQTSVSDPVYPTLASSTGVNTIGITTTGLVFINNTNSLGVGTNNPKANLHVVGSIETDDINTGSGKFNTNISHSVYTTPTGVLTPIITFPGTSGKRYIVHSINVANVARVQPQGASATVGINTLAGAVTSVTIDGVGVGYTDGDIGSPTNLNVSFATTSYVGVGTTGDPAYSGITSALGYITSVSGGAVTGVAITFNGFGYTSPPVVTFAPPIGGGTTETGTSVLTYGEVNAVYLNSLGEGYKTAPEVTIQSELGVGAKITSEVDNDGRVIGLNIISRGYGYSRNNSLGNNEENEVYIDLPPLAKTEVGVDVEIDRYPVGGGTTVSSYLAFDVPVPVGGVLEVLKQPAVMNPGDILKMRGIDSEGSGLDDAIDVSICYEETNDNYIGYGTATPANIGIGTEILNIGIISATTNPVLLQSLRLTNTEFVGDYDVSIKVVTGAGQTYYLARNLVIPSFSSIELFDAPKRIEAGSYLLMDAETVGVDANEASTIDIQVSGKRII